MKKGIIVLIAVLAVIAVLVFSIIGSYNGLVEKQAGVDEAQAAISTHLQRRADLIPNFVATVKGYSNFEKETLTAVTEARSAVKDASTIGETQAAADQLDKAISVWVNAVTEAYPELKASAQYVAMQDELAGTENRIAQARKDYNASAKEYNVAIRKFPRSIIAGMFGFDKADYFTADDSAADVPQVSFE